jgi:hypothetical protein
MDITIASNEKIPELTFSRLTIIIAARHRTNTDRQFPERRMSVHLICGTELDNFDLPGSQEAGVHPQLLWILRSCESEWARRGVGDGERSGSGTW